MKKLFDVIATEENVGYGTTSELTQVDLIAVEEATLAIVAVENMENMIEDADALATQIEAQVGMEEALLSTPEQVTVGAARLAVGSSVLIGSAVGCSTQIGLEDDIADPVRTLTVALEEKRGILKKMYDGAVILLKKLINMAKKAFGKIVMTLNGNEGSLKKLEEEVKKIDGSVEVSAEAIKTILDKYPLLTFKGTLNGGAKEIKEMIEANVNPLTATKTLLKVVDGVTTLITMAKSGDGGKYANEIKNIDKIEDFTTDAVGKYIGTHKQKLFGDVVTGDFSYKLYSGTPYYFRAIVTGGTEKNLLIKNAKIKYDEGKKDATYNPQKVIKNDIVDMVTSAAIGNKGIKSYLDDATTASNLALDEATAAGKKSDENENADTEGVKIAIGIQKIAGSVGYSMAMDRYKNIRAAISYGSAVAAAVESAKKK